MNPRLRNVGSTAAQACSPVTAGVDGQRVMQVALAQSQLSELSCDTAGSQVPGVPGLAPVVSMSPHQVTYLHNSQEAQFRFLLSC